MKIRLIALAFAAVAALTTPAAAADKPRVDIGWTAWADAEVVSKLTALILQGAMNRDVELTLADVSMQYRALEAGRLDAMLMSWQPLTHKSYLRRYDDISSAGVLYQGAKLGLAVPAYVPEDLVSSIDDLAKPAVREKMRGRIVGIDPNSGLMGMTREAVPTYRLEGYELVEGTGPSMTKTLDEAVEAGDWIVVTAWTPHWLFGAHEMRFLEDPKGTFGGAEAVHAMVRPGLRADDPELYGFLSRMSFDLDELQGLMAEVREQGDREALIAWIRNNRETVARWIGR